ncbi:hypothetical protein M7I_2428 [Glarea lozoyensis 74030]|uniref:Uncharacterized protein n=1 Tax=Glarea lozoyensis (strain ATCC 74030 / MF5533) TaxID=1104152 RepID=H0EIR3_GLAL7|nr:hypothetical protein M7I_2428 [Glarea lozoyensis 74030]
MGTPHLIINLPSRIPPLRALLSLENILRHDIKSTTSPLPNPQAQLSHERILVQVASSRSLKAALLNTRIPES